jgi:hypothetical protein
MDNALNHVQMVGLHATPEELTALKDIIGKIKSRTIVPSR